MGLLLLSLEDVINPTQDEFLNHPKQKRLVGITFRGILHVKNLFYDESMLYISPHICLVAWRCDIFICRNFILHHLTVLISYIKVLSFLFSVIGIQEFPTFHVLLPI